jgi:hypothetical protein
VPRLRSKRGEMWGTGFVQVGRDMKVERDLDRESRTEKWRIERNKRKAMRKKVCGEPVA